MAFTQIASQLVSDLQRSLGLTKAQAQGLVGSLAYETGGFNTLQETSPVVPGSAGGYGYAQWTGPRRTDFFNYANANGLDPSSYAANAGFLQHELTTTEAPALSAIRAATTSQDAARAATSAYLRPGYVNMPARLDWTGKVTQAGLPPNSSGGPDDRAIDGYNPPNVHSVPLAPLPQIWTSPTGNVYRVGDVMKTGNATAGESNYVITPNGPQKLGYTPANTGPTVMSGIVGKVAQQAVSQAQQAIPAAASNAAGAVGSFFGNLFGGGSKTPAAPPPLPNNGGWNAYLPPPSLTQQPTTAPDDPSSWGYIQSPQPIKPPSLSALGPPPSIAGTDITSNTASWAKLLAPPAAPAPVWPMSPSQDELAALRQQAENPLQKLFGTTPIGHVASFLGGLGQAPHYGAPAQGGLLSLLTGHMPFGLGGQTTPSPAIASLFSALTPQQQALQSPAALAAGNAGQSYYSSAGGGIIPTLTTSGQARNSYGDDANHLGSSLTQSWF